MDMDMDMESNISRSPRDIHIHNPPPRPRKCCTNFKRNIYICIGLAVAVCIAILIIVLILSFTLFKPKRPVINLHSLALDHLSLSLDTPRFRVNLNLTLHLNLSLHNPNNLGFNYKPNSVLLDYRGQLVGQVPLPAGNISPGQTLEMNLNFTLLADRFLSNSQLYSDVISGELPLNTKSRISGKVHILGMFKIDVVASSSCDFVVFVANTTVGDQNCKYKTRL